MKRILPLLLACVLLALNAKAQNVPEVNITVDDATPTTITVSFDKNEACLHYGCLISDLASIYQWLPMYGNDTARIIKEWAYDVVNDTTWHWNDMTPGMEYTIFAVAYGSDDCIIYSITTTMPTQGDDGTSVISIDVSDITSTSAVVTCTPNASTASFKDMLMETQYFNTLGSDSVIAMLKEDPYTYYETDNWTWMSMTPDMEYNACAIGLNGVGEWGPLAVATFRTSTAGIASTSDNQLAVFPNPTTGIITIEGAPFLEAALYDLQGKKLMDVNNRKADLGNLPNGAYLLRIDMGGRMITKRIVKK